MYYVYEWFVVETGEIIYAGKGTGNRYKVKSQRNRFFTEMLKRHTCDSRIVKEFESEQDAFAFEYDYINELKSKGQCVCNIHCGGAGGSGELWTDELRKEYSKNNVMKSEAQRARMSKCNPMKDKITADVVRRKKQRPVIVGGREYESVKDACEKLHTTSSTIRNWCLKGVNQNGEQCRYANSTQVQFSGKRYNIGSCKPLTYKGVRYESPIDLAAEMGCSVTKLYHWLQKGFDHYGNPIRYEDDTRTFSFERKRGGNHPIILNGIKYPSISAAARANNVSSQWLGDILRGKHTSTKYICKYDNQQPSQGNTDSSTLEGSTTNG